MAEGASAKQSPAARLDARVPASLNIPLAEIPRLLGLAQADPAQAQVLNAFIARHAGEPHQAIGLADYFRLLRELAALAKDETFAMSARPMALGTAEFVLSNALRCGTVGEAMRQIAHGYNILHGDNYNVVEQRGHVLAYSIDDSRFPYTRPRDDYLHFSLECTLIFLHSALCELAGENFAPALRRVSTRRPAPGGAVRQALAFWEAPVEYGSACYGLTYDGVVGDHPLPLCNWSMPADLAVHNRIISLIEAKQAGARSARPVSDQVRQAMTDGLKDQADIAKRLGVSLATLRRRLAGEGESFRGIRHQVLNHLAKTRLQTAADIAEVAENLGFSDRRSFTRAFKGWNGLTPTSFRSNRPHN